MTPITPSVASSGSTEVSTFVFSDTFPTQYGIGHNDHAVRVVQIDGEPWFVAKDVCDVLGYSHTPSAVRDNVDPSQVDIVRLAHGKRGNPNRTVISEGGVYSLILGSKLPSAKKFKLWVTRDVLPTIRKTGQYNTSAAAVAKGEMSFAEMTAKVMQGLLEQVELEKKKAAKLEHRNKNLTKVNASLTDELHYVTVREFLDHHLGIYAAPGLSVRLGKAATKIYNENGYELRREDKELVNKGKVIISSIGVYPHEVLLEAWEKNVKHFYEAQKVHG
ncbi:BRO family, N-terminal domain [Cohaesibacter marisflavi]|uniref:BRO family, N-terminal domain n=1 Tax=Cohaesibacter marisflavi TaxID=655353 RepID=A0A1I5GQL3_9HYPH|nr:BRO family protein [Cohaesibacter marisflavi]SFO38223.1 BRO family, N-terminal domain [Cohaesibacter marisflavi]